MDVLLVNDTSDGLNWGSQSTTKALRGLVNDAGGNIKYTKYKAGLQKRESAGFHHGLNYYNKMVRNIFSSMKKTDIKNLYTIYKDAFDIVPRYFSEFDKFANKAVKGEILQQITQRIRDSDIVVINGEGMMYTSRSRATRMFLFIVYLSKKYLNTPCTLINHTLDIQDEILYEMVKEVYPLLDDVVFREPLSKRRYEHFCSNCRSGADVVFSLNYNLINTAISDLIEIGALNVKPYGEGYLDFEKNYICVAGSSIFSKIGYNIEGMKNLCRSLMENFGQVVLIVTAYSDSNLMYTVAEELDLSVVGLNTPIKSSINILANASAYVGGRYHPTIFSIIGNTPIIPLSANTPKLEGIFELVGIDPNIYEIDDICGSCDDIVKDIHGARDNNYRLISNHKQVLIDLDRKSKENIKEIKDN